MSADLMETWRVIPGFERYEVSDLGQVRSNLKEVPRILKTHPAGRGYKYVSLGKAQHRSVHSLVAAAFIGARPKGLVLRHLDGDRLNNRPANLAYGTASENQRDALAHGTNFERNKTHCKRGHEFTSGNTLQRISPRTGLPARACKTCVNAQQREWMRGYRLRRKGLAA